MICWTTQAPSRPSDFLYRVSAIRDQYAADVYKLFMFLAVVLPALFYWRVN